MQVHFLFGTSEAKRRRWNKFEEAEASESANREMSMLAVHKTHVSKYLNLKIMTDMHSLT
jgi:hypothetical protein